MSPRLLRFSRSTSCCHPAPITTTPRRLAHRRPRPFCVPDRGARPYVSDPFPILPCPRAPASAGRRIRLRTRLPRPSMISSSPLGLILACQPSERVGRTHNSQQLIKDPVSFRIPFRGRNIKQSRLDWKSAKRTNGRATHEGEAHSSLAQTPAGV